jgi:glucokinase (EC 2.7.1.2)
MALLLAGDIGGTKTILRLVERTVEGEMKALYEFRYSSGEFPDLVPMVQQFLTATAAKLDFAPVPEKACFAIAGPVVNNTAKLTNLPWMLDAKRLEQELGISHVSLINDFVAIGYGVCGLDATDLHTLQVGKPRQNAPIAVIGAGDWFGQMFCNS